MVVMFSISLVRAGLNVERIAFAVFRMMMSSLAVGIIMGIVSKPRSWCQVCPMGHATSLQEVGGRATFNIALPMFFHYKAADT